jgi:hypothetical protein
MSDCSECQYHPVNVRYTGGTQPTDVQQLRAEIAALIKWYDIPRELAIEQRTVNRAQLLEKLRQLSAV